MEFHTPVRAIATTIVHHECSFLVLDFFNEISETSFGGKIFHPLLHISADFYRQLLLKDCNGVHSTQFVELGNVTLTVVETLLCHLSLR